MAEAAAPKKQKTALATVVFAAGTTLPRVLTLIFLPVYTASLTTSEYGRLSVLLWLGVIIGMVLPLGLDLAVFRNYFKFEGEKQTQQDYVSTVWLLVAAVAPAFALVTCGVLALAVGDQQLLGDLVFTIVAYAVYAVAVPIPLTVLRAEKRLKAFIVVSVVSAFTQTTAVLVAVAVLDAGVRGWLVATLAANLVTLVVAAVVLPFRWPRAWQWSSAKESTALGVVFIPHFLAHWALMGGNRFVLAAVVTPAAVGVFSLASNLAVPAHTLGQALTQALTPNYARAAHHPDSVQYVPKTMARQIAIVLLGCMVIALVIPPIVHLITPAPYWGAADLAPWLVLGYAFLGLYYVPMNLVTMVGGKARGTWAFPVGAAVIALVLTYAVADTDNLVPSAVATSLGFGILLVCVAIYAARTDRSQLAGLHVPWGLASGCGAYALCVYLLGAEFTANDTLAGLLERSVISLVALIGAVLAARRLGLLGAAPTLSNTLPAVAAEGSVKSVD